MAESLPIQPGNWDSLNEHLSRIEVSGVSAARRPHRPRQQRGTYTKVTIFESGHGWTTAGAPDAATNLNDTTDFVLGSQSAKVVTGGAGASVTLGKLAMTSMNMTGKHFVAWVKLTNGAKLSTANALQMFAGDTSLANNYLLNVANLSSNCAITDGEWVPIAFDFNNASSTGAPNRAAITDLRFRIQDDGTGTKVTVQLNGVSIVPNAATPFPNGVATIWWDDVFTDAYTLGRPRMDLYNFPGVCCPIIEKIGTSGYLTLAQLKALQVNNGWQVVPHAYTTAAHDNRFSTLTAAQVDDEIGRSLDYLASNGFEELDSFAYPGGIWSTDVGTTAEASALKFFRVCRLTTAWPRQQMPVVTPGRVGALDGQSSALATFQAEVDRAYTEGEWINLVWHGGDANLNAKIDYLNTKGIPVRTATDVLASL